MPRFAGGRPPLHSQGFRLQMASQIPVPILRKAAPMSLSMYQASVPVFVTMLNNLTTILEKAETLAKERAT